MLLVFYTLLSVALLLAFGTPMSPSKSASAKAAGLEEGVTAAAAPSLSWGQFLCALGSCCATLAKTVLPADHDAAAPAAFKAYGASTNNPLAQKLNV